MLTGALRAYYSNMFPWLAQGVCACNAGNVLLFEHHSGLNRYQTRQLAPIDLFLFILHAWQLLIFTNFSLGFKEKYSKNMTYRTILNMSNSMHNTFRM